MKKFIFLVLQFFLGLFSTINANSINTSKFSNGTYPVVVNQNGINFSELLIVSQ